MIFVHLEQNLKKKVIIMNQSVRAGNLFSGEMYSMQVLDREQRSVYSVPVAVTDNGGRMTFTTVHISVSDQNDNVPQFLAQEYKITALDGLPLNYTVLQASTTGSHLSLSIEQFNAKMGLMA